MRNPKTDRESDRRRWGETLGFYHLLLTLLLFYHGVKLRKYPCRKLQFYCLTFTVLLFTLFTFYRVDFDFHLDLFTIYLLF